MVGSDRRYIALIGDIRASREIEDRQQVQQRFHAAIEALEGELPAGSIASPPTVTTGDEFQALFADARAPVRAISRVADALHPVQLRFGLGAGRLDTALNEDTAIGMDGPCFHRARDAIDEAKDRGGWVRVKGFSTTLDGNAGPLFDTVAALRHAWTDRQAEIARAFRSTGVQKAVAERFDVSPSVVSESLASAHAHEVFAAERSLAAFLAAAFAGGAGRPQAGEGR